MTTYERTTKRPLHPKSQRQNAEQYICVSCLRSFAEGEGCTDQEHPLCITCHDTWTYLAEVSTKDLSYLVDEVEQGIGLPRSLKAAHSF